MLPHLVLKTWRSVLWVALIAVLVGAAGACVRLLPWIVSNDVPWSVSLLFFKAMLIASSEVGLVLALPLGVGIEVVRWSHDGTSLALHTMGVGPLRQAANTLSVSITLGVLVAALSLQASALSESPGNLTNTLLNAASHEACAEGRPMRVPLAQAVWLCVQGKPVLVGWFPEHGSPSVVWKASEARFSPSLDRVELFQTVVAQGSSSVVRANRVSITGFLPWVLPTHVPPQLRAAAALGCSCAAAFATAWALIRWPSASVARAVVVGAVGTIAFLLFGSFFVELMSSIGLVVIVLVAAGCPGLAAWLTRTVRC